MAAMQMALAQMQQMQAAASSGLMPVQVLQPTPVINPITGQASITLVPTFALAPVGPMNPATSSGLSAAAAAQLAVAAAAAQANLMNNLSALQRAADVQMTGEHASDLVSLSSRAPAVAKHKPRQCSCDAHSESPETETHRHQPPSFSFSPVSESANDCDTGFEQCECPDDTYPFECSSASSSSRFAHAESSVVSRLHHKHSPAPAGNARDSSPPHHAARHAQTPDISAQFAEIQLDLSQQQQQLQQQHMGGGYESLAPPQAHPHLQQAGASGTHLQQKAYSCAHAHMGSMASSTSGNEAVPSPHGSHGAYLKRRSNKPVLRTRSDVSGMRGEASASFSRPLSSPLM